MNEREWRDERDSRTLRYAERRLDPDRWISVIAQPDYVESYAGQVAAITLVNLLARMTPSVALAIPPVPLVKPLPWADKWLPDFLLETAYAADPYGRFCEGIQPNSYTVRLGGEGPCVVHGSGWVSYVGSGSSPITDVRTANPFGAAFAAVLACAHLFTSDFAYPDRPLLFDTLSWSESGTDALVEELITAAAADLGTVWTVGVGSVGTAILYFLTLLTRSFSAALLDPDEVRVHNLDRSPIFRAADVGRDKVAVVRDYLTSVGVPDVQIERVPLHESHAWRKRQEGVPDLILAAANEQDVRYHIEASFPPVQVYGTTGRNWQATMLRHVPFVDPCSLCLFPPSGPGVDTRCATDSEESRQRQDGAPNMDAALPFLSFAAGLMAAAEAVKLQLPGFPFSPNRVALYTRPVPTLIRAAMAKRQGCVCSHRSASVHERMIAGSRLSPLSGSAMRPGHDSQ